MAYWLTKNLHCIFRLIDAVGVVRESPSKAAARLTMDVFLGDVLRPYERGEAPDISLKHALVHRKVQPGSDDRVFVVVIYDFRRRHGVAVGIDLRLLVVLRWRGLD